MKLRTVFATVMAVTTLGVASIQTTEVKADDFRYSKEQSSYTNDYHKEVERRNFNVVQSPNYYDVISQDAHIDLATFKTNQQDVDSLGRSQQQSFLVTIDSIRESKSVSRANLSSIKPSGWQKNKQVYIALSTGKTYHGYFYNRSHLIGDALGGNSLVSNMITGTRTQNVGNNDKTGGGMLYIENKVRNYVEDNPNVSVAYIATPLYNGNDLVPYAVLVQAKSSDNGINESVYVYNNATGYDIDYATGQYSSDYDSVSDVKTYATDLKNDVKNFWNNHKDEIKTKASNVWKAITE